MIKIVKSQKNNFVKKYKFHKKVRIKKNKIKELSATKNKHLKLNIENACFS